MSGKQSNRLAVLFGVLIVMGLAAAGVPGYVVSRVAFAVEQGKIEANRQEIAGAQELSNAFRMVARAARPGVVQINVSPSAKDREDDQRLAKREEELRRQVGELARSAESDKDSVEELMREFAAIRTERAQLRMRLPRGNGSGSVYDREGYILTNNHVVEQHDKIRVRLQDGREYSAELVGADPKSDLALIRIPADDLHVLPLGDSDAAEVGDFVLAIGAPFGLSQSVTHGIISAKGRTDVTLGRDLMYRDFLQTDAAINPGNSGGPLVNLRGEAIGVNVAIASEDGFNAGVAFVIPSKLARKVADQLRKTGEVTRGWLGVSLREVGAADAKLLGLDRTAVMVNVMYEDSPAFKAGFLCEDVILSVNDDTVGTIPQLQATIAEVSPGETAKVEIQRDGTKMTLAVVVEKQPRDINAFTRNAPAIHGRVIDPLPLELRSLRPGFLSADVDEDRRAAMIAKTYGESDGVLIVGLKGKTAESYAFEPYQLVVAVNDVPVKSLADLTRAVAASPNRIRLQLVDESGERRTIEFAR
ncbi:MAG: trypsin-like peptidase domain-containing protein [Planctomycetes bacterium]|nr:trypsin-like peptidase domain-containing protein [Planctomycetota bacterium]